MTIKLPKDQPPLPFPVRGQVYRNGELIKGRLSHADAIRNIQRARAAMNHVGW